MCVLRYYTRENTVILHIFRSYESLRGCRLYIILKMCLNIQQIYCYYILKDGIMQFSSAIVDFYLFSDGSVDMQIWTLLSRSQCRVSDTEVTVKACGPLVSNLHDCLPYHTDLLIFVLPWFVKTKQFESVYLIFFLHMYICVLFLQV